MAALLYLKEYLEEAAAAPFALGDWDCAMALANYIRLRTGNDPAPHLRGKYSTKAEWRSIVRHAGGMESLVGGIASRAGLILVANPLPGDIGVVKSRQWREIGGVCIDGKRWAMKMTHGITVWPAEVLSAWRL